MLMPHSFHFISGLPRSGSTLLAAILRQNPHIHAGISSPVGSLYNNLVNGFSAGTEQGAMVTTTQRQAILKGLFENFYQEQLAGQQVIFDTNRQWCAKLPELLQLFPQSKVVACVRNVAWILDSLERQYQHNPFENTLLFNNDVERNTVYSRSETLAQPGRLVGYAWAALKDAFYGPHADALLVVDYELLAQAPQKVLPLIYQFIGESGFEHDFDSVAFAEEQFDAKLGVKGLHTVKEKVEWVPRQPILPAGLFEQYADMSFWLDQSHSRASVISVKQ